jgi:hypothetical protein
MISFPAGTGVSWKVGNSQGNTGPTTLTVGTFGTYPLLIDSATGPIALNGGELVAGNVSSGRFDGTSIHITDSAVGTSARQNASAKTGTVAAVSAGSGLTVGHVARFNDTAGTIEDGGVMGVANSSVYLTVANNGETFGYGTYNVDTSGGAFSISLPLSPILGESLAIKDITGTWGTNNLTINPNGLTIMGSTSNLICNISGEVFIIWYNGSDWRLQ